jgi:hypothetical protein
METLVAGAHKATSRNYLRNFEAQHAWRVTALFGLVQRIQKHWQS